MSYPAEGVESAIRHHIDDVRAFLDAHHKGAYAVYNLAGVRKCTNLRNGGPALGSSTLQWVLAIRIWVVNVDV